ncbi:gamma-glutamyltranspeptidase [Neurospora hispaniola]|uniref:Glutathione hydrolase n=1 Tax=Neurospora hispaniola TaxID=588809 RepID=A0AAJ0I5U5_9PEZI|nr:gamma-glutamyltranspeptidase [Neurospora hispaniola]
MLHLSPLLCGLAVLGQLGSLVIAVPLEFKYQRVIQNISSEGHRGAVASESAICSQIGIDALRKGGSAADAMVATTLCVGTIGMYHSGIGGGGFMLVRDPDGNYHTVDYRETAPAAATQDMYNDDPNASVLGARSVAIPSELRGLEYVHSKYGRLPWHDLVMPSVKIAHDGFKVTEDLVRYMASASASDDFLTRDPVWAQDFAPNGTLLGLGDTITRKRYAKTLLKIALLGADAFYTGPIADSIIALLQPLGGILTHSDLANYEASIKPALNITYRDSFRIFATDAPSSGAVTLSILKTMEQFPSLNLSSNIPLTNHRFVEAMKFAYGARQSLGDPSFITNITSFQEAMLSPQTAKFISSKILPNSTLPLSEYDPVKNYAAASHGTSHIVTADRSGLTLSSTTTINLLFGSRLMTPDTGIILNDEMDDFSQPNKNNSFGFVPSPSNFIRAGKRPLSSICPLMVEHVSNGSLWFATGAAGGSRIISSTTQVAFNVLEGLAVHPNTTDLKVKGVGGEGSVMRAAVAAPRLHDQLMPEVLLVEKGYGQDVYDDLKRRGHNVTWQAPGLSAVQAVMRFGNGTFVAASETRQVNSGGFAV